MDVPNASSAYLGNLVYYLAKRPALYDELENEISGQTEVLDSAIKLPVVVKDCAKAIVDYIYKLDELESIIERIEIMDQSIKINTGNTDGFCQKETGYGICSHVHRQECLTQNHQVNKTRGI